MPNGKGTFLFSIQVHTHMHTHILKGKHVSTVKHIHKLHLPAHAQAHTHSQRHTLIHSHSHNKYVCNGKAHACFTHVLSTGTHKEIQIYTQALTLQCTQTHSHISYIDLVVPITDKYRCTLTRILKQGHTPSSPTPTSHWSLEWEAAPDPFPPLLLPGV